MEKTNNLTVCVLISPRSFCELGNVIEGIDITSIPEEHWKLTLNKISNVHRWAVKVNVNNTDFALTIPVIIETEESDVEKFIRKGALILSIEEVVEELIQIEENAPIIFSETKVYPGFYVMVVENGIQELKRM